MSSVSAVTVNSTALPNKEVFAIKFDGSNRAFVASEKSVSSVSLQEYITASYRVLEINLVTTGNALLRIYYSRLLLPGEAQTATSDAVAAATGKNINAQLPPSVQAMTEKMAEMNDKFTSTTVVKEYPLATHARTIEYRLSSRQQLIALYEELEKHWVKEPAFFKAGEIVTEEEAVNTEMKPRSLGGTTFSVE
jgi:hypothetical protein